MEIRGSNPIVPITLKLTANTRGEFVLTTLPVADLDLPAAAGSLLFPHLALGGGFTTRRRRRQGFGRADLKNKPQCELGSTLRISKTEIRAYLICPRKTWYSPL